jgi:hypothetical protein
MSLITNEKFLFFAFESHVFSLTKCHNYDKMPQLLQTATSFDTTHSPVGLQNLIQWSQSIAIAITSAVNLYLDHFWIIFL